MWRFIKSEPELITCLGLDLMNRGMTLRMIGYGLSWTDVWRWILYAPSDSATGGWRKRYADRVRERERVVAGERARVEAARIRAEIGR